MTGTTRKDTSKKPRRSSPKAGGTAGASTASRALPRRKKADADKQIEALKMPAAVVEAAQSAAVAVDTPYVSWTSGADGDRRHDVHHMIAEAAYFLAEKRGFRDGSPEADWFEAEAQIRARVSQRQAW